MFFYRNIAKLEIIINEIINLIIVFVPIILTRVGLGINAKLKESTHDPALSLGFLTTGLDESVEIAEKESERPFYKGQNDKSTTVKERINKILEDLKAAYINYPS